MLKRTYIPVAKVVDAQTGTTTGTMFFYCEQRVLKVFQNTVNDIDYSTLPTYGLCDNIIMIVARSDSVYYYYLNGKIYRNPASFIITDLVRQQGCKLGNAKIINAGTSKARISLLKGDIYTYKEHKIGTNIKVV